jgi:hypothetical protein
VVGLDSAGIFLDFDDVRLQTVLKLAPLFAASALLTDLIAWNLSNGAHRHILLEDTDIDWTILWGTPLDEQDAFEYLNRFAREIAWHEERCGDHDVAFTTNLSASSARRLCIVIRGYLPVPQRC